MANSNFLRFNGSSWLSLASSASNSFSGDFTIEAYIRLTSTSGGPYSIFGVGGGATNFDFRYYLNNFQVSQNAGTGTNIGGSLSANTWTHVALVRSGTAINCYVNGVATSITLSNSTALGATAVAYVGASDTGPINRFNGDICNLRIVRGTALYTRNFRSADIPFSAVTNTVLLTAQDSTIIDRSAAPRTLTQNGSVTVNFGDVGPTSWALPITNLGAGTIMPTLSSYGSSPIGVSYSSLPLGYSSPDCPAPLAGVLTASLNASAAETAISSSLNSTEMDWNRILWLTRV